MSSSRCVVATWPATILGKPTRSNGRRPRRRRHTTSITCQRSAQSDRCSTFVTAARPRTEPPTMTANSRALVPAEHTPIAGLSHDRRGGISNPVLGMLLFITSEVMFFGGLFAAYFSVRANAAQWPPEEFHQTLKILPLVGPATVLLI